MANRHALILSLCEEEIMNKKNFIVILTVLLVSACAHEALIKPTTSGFPEGIFNNTTVEEVQSKIMNGCTLNGLNIYDTNRNQVICGKITSGMDAVLAGVAIGNQYSTTPERKIRFSIFQQGADVKVVAQEWIETQMAFGQIKQMPLDNNKHKNSIQQFLFSLGGR
jgi:hypothetical protein